MEDNRVRTLVRGLPLRLPFSIKVRAATIDQYPTKQQLLNYFHEVRAVTEQRLRDTTDRDFDRIVEKIDFGRLTVREVWTGVVASFAWHAGKIALTAKLASASPVKTMEFHCWKRQV